MGQNEHSELVDRIRQAIHGHAKNYGCNRLLNDLLTFFMGWRYKAKKRPNYTLAEIEELLATCSNAVKILQVTPEATRIKRLVEDCIHALDNITEEVTKQINDANHKIAETLKKLKDATEIVRSHLLVGVTTEAEKQYITAFAAECMSLMRDSPEVSNCCTLKERVGGCIQQYRWWLRAVYKQQPTLIMELIEFGFQFNNPQINDLVVLLMETIINDKT